jgi:outer membrane protein OmpA-like peptidoglycan-associated protein
LVTDLFGKREEIAGPLQAPTKPIAEERSQTEVSLPANLPIAPVYFDRGRSEITAEGAASIAQAAELARRYPGKKIKIIGHADPVEEGVESTFLAKARAEAVSRYLTAYHQISLLRIVVRGQGGENPVSAPGEANAANRRVELLLE